MIVVVAGVLSSAVLSSCALTNDRQPRNILEEEQPTVVSATVDADPQTGTGSIVYFLGPPGESSQSPLIPVGRAATADPAELTAQLLEGPTASEQEALGLRTAVPVGTRLLDSSLDSQGTLTVNLSSEFLANAGDVLLDAVAQMVVTASRSSGTRRVRLLVEGEPQDWPTGEGTSTRDPLSIYDFVDRVLTNPLQTSTTTVSSGSNPTTRP